MSTGPHEPEFKTCPECAEEIKYEAIKCRFCGYRYEPETQPVSPDLLACIEAKVERGERLDTYFEYPAYLREHERVLDIQGRVLKVLVPAWTAEQARIGRPLTHEEQRTLHASDSVRAAAFAKYEETSELEARLSRIQSLMIALRQSATRAGLTQLGPGTDRRPRRTLRCLAASVGDQEDLGRKAEATLGARDLCGLTTPFGQPWTRSWRRYAVKPSARRSREWTRRVRAHAPIDIGRGGHKSSGRPNRVR